MQQAHLYNWMCVLIHTSLVLNAKLAVLVLMGGYFNRLHAVDVACAEMLVVSRILL
jgi:hypothetical protein